MSEPFTIRIPRRWLRTALVVLVTAAVVVPATAFASARFNDVAGDNTFSKDIDWLADAGVTAGCNPPANDQFCPKDNVTREQMAAFMRRLAEKQVVDAGTVDGVDSAQLTRNDRFYTVGGPPTEKEMLEENVYVGAFMCDPGDVAVSPGYIEDADQFVWGLTTGDGGAVAIWYDDGTSGNADLEMTARCLDVNGTSSHTSDDRTYGGSVDELLQRFGSARG